jgi:hypothetical protein
MRDLIQRGTYIAVLCSLMVVLPMSVFGQGKGRGGGVGGGRGSGVGGR